MGERVLAGRARSDKGERWPDFLVIGSPRCGTTTLYDVLSATPSICMSRIKEPRYFNRAIDFTSWFTETITDTNRYLALWEHCDANCLRGEASPTYFQDPFCPGAVKERIPLARLVLILRNPVDRAISHFQFREKRTGRSETTLSEAIDRAEAAESHDYECSYLLEPGFYGRHLARWLECFDREQIKILLLEHLIDRFEQELTGLLHFLGARIPDSGTLPRPRRNVAAVPKSRFAGKLLRSGLLKALVRRAHAEQLAIALAERLLLKSVGRVPVASDVGERLLLVYRDDIQEFERLSGVRTGWLDSR